jgi:hypothetical protein
VISSPSDPDILRTNASDRISRTSRQVFWRIFSFVTAARLSTTSRLQKEVTEAELEAEYDAFLPTGDEK